MNHRPPPRQVRPPRPLRPRAAAPGPPTRPHGAPGPPPPAWPRRAPASPPGREPRRSPRPGPPSSPRPGPAVRSARGAKRARGGALGPSPLPPPPAGRGEVRERGGRAPHETPPPALVGPPQVSLQPRRGSSTRELPHHRKGPVAPLAAPARRRAGLTRPLHTETTRRERSGGAAIAGRARPLRVIDSQNGGAARPASPAPALHWSAELSP